MTTKKKAQGTPKGKAGAERRDELQRQMRAGEIKDLAEIIEAVLFHPDTPATLRQHIRYGLSEVFNDLKNNDRVTDSADHIALLLTQHAEESKGGGL
jgi:hypothetical protein